MKHDSMTRSFLNMFRNSSWLLLALISTCPVESSETKVTPIPVAGYLPDYRAGDNGALVNRTAPHLTDLLLFSIEVHSRGMVGGCCLNQEHYESARKARETYQPNLNLWITVGGQGRTNSWSTVVQDPTKRSRLISSLQRLCERENLQGIDLDIFTTMRTQQDLVANLEFLREANDVWRKEHGLLLSVALHPGQALPELAYSYLDRIHLMTYDTPRVDEATQALGNDKVRVGYTQQSIQKLLESKCPSHLIWIGIPLYATSRTTGQVQTYAELWDSGVPMDRLESLGNAEANQAIQTVVGDDYQYDRPYAMVAKLMLVQQLKLGGVFLWELGHDKPTSSSPGGVILEAIAHGAKSYDLAQYTMERSQKESPHSEL